MTDSPRIRARITHDPISLDELVDWVADRRAGAVVTFTGTTRDVESLHYEAYEEMAAQSLERIAAEVAAAHGAIALAVDHRLGDVPLTQPSVAIAVSSGHRPEAFAAARACIDRIKAEVPIWKKEVDGDSAQWVEGTPVETPR